MISADSNAADVIFWGLVVIVAIGVLGLVVWGVRRWSLGAPAKGGDDAWSLQHLRDMRAQGQITDEEFEALKSKLLRASTNAQDRTCGATSADGR